MLQVEKLNSISPPRIRLFGGVQIQSERLITSHFRSGRVAALFAYLTLHSTGEVSREELADRLWPNLDGPTGRNNLRVTLQYLKRALAEHGLGNALRVDRNWVFLDQELVTSDAHEFRNLCALARLPANADERTTLLRSALEIARGALAPELYDDWLAPVRDEIARERFSASTELADALLDTAPGEAFIYAREACSEQPLSDHARELLATSFLRLGQPAAAALELRDHDQKCRRELGHGMSPVLSRMLAEIEGPSRALQNRRSVPRPATAYYGREAERATIAVWLREPGSALLTLYGPGGIGKTRLATEAAAAVQDRMKCVWVDLAHVRSGAALLETVSFAALPTAVAGYDCILQIEQALGREPCLLILDNLEQIPDGELLVVGDLMESLPTVKILATSRKILGVGGETLMRLEPLVLPSQGAPFESPALRMFLDRARSCRAGEPLTDADIELAVELALRLEGIPLAIELAAARMTALGVRDLLEGMSEPLDLLVSTKHAQARQSGLRATLDWSFSQVPGECRTAIYHLATFAGSWTLEAALAICAPDCPPSWGGLMVQTACEHSLASPIADTSPTRYRMLEMTREYALSCIDGESQLVLEGAHASYYLQLAMRRIGDPSLLDELPNLEIALTYFARDPERTDGLIRMAEALNWLWWETGAGRTALRVLQEVAASAHEPSLRARILCMISLQHFATYAYAEALAAAREGAELAACGCERALEGRLLGLVARGLNILGQTSQAEQTSLDALDKVGLNAAIRAEVLQNLARVYNTIQEPAVLAVAGEAVLLARQSGDPTLLIDVLDTAISVNLGRHEFGQAHALLEEAMSLRAHHVPNGLNSARILLRQAALAGKLGRPAEARERYEEAAEIGRRSQNHWVTSQSLTQIGDFSLLLGDPEYALVCHLEGLAMRRSSSERLGVVTNLLGAGLAMQALDRPREAFAMLSEALAMSDELGQQYHQATCLVPCAELAADLGDFGTAVELADRAERLWVNIRDVGRNPDLANIQQHLTRVATVQARAAS